VNGDIVGALVTLAIIGLIADINSGAIVGGVLSVRSGWGPGFAFLGGSSGVRIIQGLFGLGLVYAIVDTFLGFVRLDQTTFMLMALAGLAIVLAGARQLVTGKEDVPKPKQLEESETAGAISVRAALVTGLVINIISLRQWIFTSLAVSTIGAARVEWPVGLALFAAYLALSSWLTVGLLILKAVRPSAAPAIMDRIAAWTDMHLATIVAWFAVVVGVLLMGYGLYQWLR
jgi:hypothetical protein